MSYKVISLNLDLLRNRTMVSLTKTDGPTHHYVQINIPIENQGNQAESALKATAREAAKRALREAADAL